MSREAMYPEANATMTGSMELDSDGSSCEESRKRMLHAQGEHESSGPNKKRRKQSTPVRFPISLSNELRLDEEEDDDEDNEEGKPSSRTSPLSINSANKDENLNSEFRCQYCSMLFDREESLNAHRELEHSLDQQQASLHRQQSTDSPNEPVELSVSPNRTESSEIHPNNSSSLSVKSFANSWLNQAQLTQQASQPRPEEWPGSINQLPALSHRLQALSGCFPAALTQFLPIPGFPITDPTQLPRPPMSSAPVRIFNPDAYCDLCNKEFCNKYFLKTHKANKHGIYVDSPGVMNNQQENNTSGMFLPNFAQNAVKMEPMTPPTIANLSRDVCQKLFRNTESPTLMKRPKIKQLESGEISDSQTAITNEEENEIRSDSPSGMEALFKQEFVVEQENAAFASAPRHLSPKSTQQARESGFNVDRLRRLGIINPEAFCEICCKEYCNKYFLRTHKMKRHGIVIHDNEKSPEGTPGPATWHRVQTSPLNLIMAEVSGNGSESSDRPGNDHECKHCDIRFQTVELYMTHNRKFHDNEEDRNTSKQELEASDRRAAESISEDLKKLQTMILQLNGLDSTKSTVCAICGMECESTTGLRTHMAIEHAIGDEQSAMAISPKQENITPPPVQQLPINNTTVYCNFCERDFSSQDALRKHISDEHQSPVSVGAPVPRTPTTPITPAIASASSTPTNSVQPEKKLTSMTPTSSYCEICNKELCNKYFMKTHMQRMHGIEIENGAQIGGVICNICNKELCSKYFLRVHKHNTHGIVDDNVTGSSKQDQQQQPQQSLPPPQQQQQQSFDPAAISEDSAALKPEQLGDLSHRYFTHFTEVCPMCARRFRSVKWLKAHLLTDHGNVGIDKWREMELQYQTSSKTNSKSSNGKSSRPSSNLKIPNGFEPPQQFKSIDYSGLGNHVLSNLFGTTSEQDPRSKSYRCAYCNFSTTILPFLFLHEKSHVNDQENAESSKKSLQCPICSQVFQQPDMLHRHLLTKHQFPNLLSHFQPPVFGAGGLEADKSNEILDRNRIDLDLKEENNGSNSNDNSRSRPDDAAVHVTPQGAYKCAQCGFATTNLNRIKKHVRKDHKSIGDPIDSVIAELGKTLKELANRQKIPVCYATPQDMNSNPDKTIMQAFLIEEAHDRPIPIGPETNNVEKRFAPALIYLPVTSRVNGSLTASFTLTPA